jgi:hypothetical protein
VAIDRVKQLLAVQLPGPQSGGLLFAGSLLLKGLSLFRRVRLYRNPVNAAALGVGHAIDFAIGGKPGVKEIARFVFLAVSIVKCAEDLIELKRHFSDLKGHLTGRSYVLMRKDPSFQIKKWSTMGPRFDASWLWFRKVGLERMRLSALLIASIVRRMGSLAVHLGDAQAALTEDHVSAVVIHGHALWKKLTDNDAILVKKLQGMQGQTDAMLKVLNLPFTADLFIKALLVPAEAKAKLPGLGDLKRGIKEVIELGKIHVGGTIEEARGIDPSLRKYQLDPKGKDAVTLKIIEPPIRVVN